MKEKEEKKKKDDDDKDEKYGLVPKIVDGVKISIRKIDVYFITLGKHRSRQVGPWYAALGGGGYHCLLC